MPGAVPRTRKPGTAKRRKKEASCHQARVERRQRAVGGGRNETPAPRGAKRFKGVRPLAIQRRAPVASKKCGAEVCKRIRKTGVLRAGPGREARRPEFDGAHGIAEVARAQRCHRLGKSEGL